MRLLHLVPSLNPATGGVVSALESLNWALEDAGHEMDVICLDDPRASWLAREEVRVTALGYGHGPLQYHPRLCSLIKEKLVSADLCIVHGLWKYHGYAARVAAMQRRKPYFVMPHGMLDPWFRKQYPLKHLKKWLYWLLGEYRVIRDATGVLFTCQEEKELARQSFPSLYAAREEVVGLGLRDNGHDEGKLKERFYEMHPELRGKRIFLFLGRLHPKKGLESLIKAFGVVNRRAPQMQLVIAGSVSGTDVGADYLDRLVHLANQECPPRSVHFCGLLEGVDKWAALCAADAFVLTSHQENFGMAVVEALSCSLPVLISNRVNIWREIQSDRAGFVGLDSNEGNAELLDRWLALSETQRNTMREQARASFDNRFEIRRVAEVFASVVGREVGQRRSAALA